MAQCVNCRNEIGTASFCPACGAQQAGGYAAPGGRRGTNGMAIASLVLAFFCFPLGIVFGHIALSQMKRTGEDGRGLAIAGLVISYAWLGLILLGMVFGVFASAFGGSNYYGY